MAVTFELNDKFTLSLEEAGVVEGVGWMNYFLVIFIALPLALLLTVKVTQKTCLDISSLLFQVTYNRMEHDRRGEIPK